MQKLTVLLILAAAVAILIRHMAPRFFRPRTVRARQKAGNTGCPACSGCTHPEPPPACEIHLHPENIPKP